MNNAIKINTKNISIYILHNKYRLKYDYMILSKNVDLLNSYYNKYCDTSLSTRSMCIQRKDCICGYAVSKDIKSSFLIEVDYFNLYKTFMKSKHTNVWNFYLGYNYILYRDTNKYTLKKIGIKEEYSE